MNLFIDRYLLLAEFSVRTVNYGPSFFPSIYGPGAKRAGHKSMEKKRGSVIYSTDRKNEANKMFIIWLLPVWGTGNIFGAYWRTKTIAHNKGFPRK